jgi:serine/threonine protein kinase
VTTGAEQGGDPRIGTVAAGKYKILRLIGRGGMGSVYEAQNVAIGKRVALKFVIMEKGADSATLARFHREARAISSIESAHIVQVFDTDETREGEPFLVMELLQGESLGERIRKQGRLSVAEAVGVVIQALRGLRRAHAAGIVHRDLKPENLLLVKGEDDMTHVKIVDFGLSKVIETLGASSPDTNITITQEGAMVGTPLYMSPEQMEARPDVDHRTDIWSMGAILYEALAGSPPFPEKTYARLVIAICQQDPRDIQSLSPDVPPAVARAASRALERDRAKRFQTAEEFLKALIEATSDLDRSLLGASVLGASLVVPPDSASSPSGRSSQEPTDMLRVTPVQAEVAKTAASPAASQPRSDDSSPGRADAPSAELKTYTVGGATLWLSQSPAFSIWRGEVAAPDRLRIEGRDGTVQELRLEPVGPLRLGRSAKVGDETNELVYPDVASRLAATLRHDGVRWWLRRREECSVPVQVGARALQRAEEAPLVHGTFVSVGGMRATMVDRRYVTPTVPAGTVDPATGLLGRAGLEQEVASLLQRQRAAALVLLRPKAARPASGQAAQAPQANPGGGDVSPAIKAVVALHKEWSSVPVAYAEGTAVLLFSGSPEEASQKAKHAADVARGAGLDAFGCGYWMMTGDSLDAGREIELALHAIQAFADGGGSGVVSLRDAAKSARVATAPEVLSASIDAKRVTLLFAIEEQSALASVGPHVIGALEQELAAVVASHAGTGALVAPLAHGVVAACVTRKVDSSVIGSGVQCDWHARPPVMDGKVELPRTLSWEILHGEGAATRAAEISRECNDPHGVLSALSGGLPYPIAGRVHGAMLASSAIERVKILFDVLEGTWRFIATVLVSAYFAKRVAPGETPSGFDQMLDFYKRAGTRDGLSLGTWRELARAAARGFTDKGDPIGALAKDVLDVKLSHNQTFDTLSNLMQVERNSFAHGHYNEAKAAADLLEFEQMTRTLLRALRPLAAWTLVTVEKTEPDLYGELQTVEFIDHTGPFNTGTRRRIGLNSPVRLANVVYLARWREGLVLPLDPFVRRIAHEDKFDLYWMDHLPRAGICHMSSAVGGPTLKTPCDVRRLPPLLRLLIERSQA